MVHEIFKLQNLNSWIKYITNILNGRQFDNISKYGIITKINKRGLEYQPNDIVNIIITKLELPDQLKLSFTSTKIKTFHKNKNTEKN